MTIIETHTVPTARCQPWCHDHHLDETEDSADARAIRFAIGRLSANESGDDA